MDRYENMEVGINLITDSIVNSALYGLNKGVGLMDLNLWTLTYGP